MDLNKIYSWERTGSSTPSDKIIDPRTEYRRDFDRIVFSSAFRRLQNKTQVFPLPGTVFVHNRLTHSLEVASLGRSLGNFMGQHILQNYQTDLTPESKGFYQFDLPEVIASACLCHDIGNPAFGHSGEDAIADYFIRNKNDASFTSHFSDEEWNDFTHFEGNANAIRCLTGQQAGKESGGLGLTYSTLSSIIKYPCSSSKINSSKLACKKFGFFKADIQTMDQIVEKTAMCKLSDQEYGRHPFVWLVETADDICYNIIDLEDAHRLRIIDHYECREILLKLIDNSDPSLIKKVKTRLNDIEDRNDQIAYLRAKSIGLLIYKANEVIAQHFESILDASLNQSVFDIIKQSNQSLRDIEQFSISNIYNHRSVVEIENAGYHVMYQLLDHFIAPILKPSHQRKSSEKKAVQLIPKQFINETGTPYMKVLGVLDYVSGMTDNYAADLYKKIRGISMGFVV